MITGQLIFRETGGQVPDGENPRQSRNVFMVVGLIAIPEVCDYKGEYQYVVTGHQNLLLHQPGVDRTEDIKGMDADSMLTSQIWRF